MIERSKREKVELRGYVARYIIDVVDAVATLESAAKQRRVERIEVVRGILKAWADKKIREAAVIGRVAGNGNRGE